MKNKYYIKNFFVYIVLLFTLLLASCASESFIDNTINLSGAYISILGDSISTYEGYSNDSNGSNSTLYNNAVFYSTNTGGLDVSDTWWMQVINHTNAMLLVNNSWSGSCVLGGGVSSGNGMRAKNLHSDVGINRGVNPDIIIVYLGINDFNSGIDSATFAENYEGMLSRIADSYNEAKIFCMLLPYCYGANIERLSEYNSIISDSSNTISANVIDTSIDGWTEDTYNDYLIDGVHPNKKGMDVLTNSVILAFSENFTNSYLSG